MRLKTWNYQGQPAPAINPHQTPRACVQMFAILYHAERAAMEAFDRLADPRIVENCEIFIQARPFLVAEEDAHARDMAEIICSLGGSGIPPVPPGFDDLWSLELSQQKLAFPLRAGVAALYTLIAESLGYGFLYQLTDSISQTDVHIGSVLRRNVEDEENTSRCRWMCFAPRLQHPIERPGLKWPCTFPRSWC
jgi:hypothetical protein